MALFVLLAACTEGSQQADTTSLEVDIAVTDTVSDADQVQPEDTRGPESDNAPDVTDAAEVLDVDPLSPLGGTRPARVVVPSDYDHDDHTNAHPLVILLHGYSATGQIQDFYLDFSPRAASRGFIAVVPEGTVNPGGLQYWNASPGWCCDFLDSGVDDAGYLLGLVTEAKSRFNIDAARVYLVGHSNGGFMSYKLACEHADVFAAIVSIAGAMPLAEADCAPSEAVSVLQVHGTLDTVINFYGTFGQYPSAVTAIERWAGHNGCATAATSGDTEDYDNNVIGAETTLLTHQQCQAGAAELWRMTGSAHVPAFAPSFVPAALDWLLAHPKMR
jgi:polyhydroxybutyrate depolymerase